LPLPKSVSRNSVRPSRNVVTNANTKERERERKKKEEEEEEEEGC